LWWLLVLAACGRTNLEGEADASVDASVRVDASVALVRQAPRYVFTGDCPTPGVEDDLRPAAGERVVLVETFPQEECSGAGGDYLVGHEAGVGDYFLGAHACYFLPRELQVSSAPRFWGVARVAQTAAIFTTPAGWCITAADGGEPVTTDSRVKAWALYGSLEAAQAAIEHYRR
jgi:hypothetical protein